MMEDLHFLHSNHMPRCTARVDKHFEGYYSLQLMTRGRVEITYDDRAYRMAEGWFWPCFPGPFIRFHSAAANRSWDHRYVAFAGPQVARWEAAGLMFKSPQPMPASREPMLVRLFDELLDQARRTDRFGRLRAANLLEQVLLILAEERAPSEASPPAWLGPILKKLETFDGPVDYAGLAERAGMSHSTLRRRFRAATGVAVHTYRLQCRIAAARSLLGDTDLPIKAVADRLGYRDVFYFTRQFHEHVGIAPAAYRRSRQR